MSPKSNAPSIKIVTNATDTTHPRLHIRCIRDFIRIAIRPGSTQHKDRWHEAGKELEAVHRSDRGLPERFSTNKKAARRSVPPKSVRFTSTISKTTSRYFFV
jgi:hypothetical protein